MSEFLNPNQAFEIYNLQVNNEALESPVEKYLRENGITAIEIPLSPDDFNAFSHNFSVVLNECPEALKKTVFQADSRYGGEVGYTRKNTKFENGLQVADPKNYFHFTEKAKYHWKERFANGPKIMQDFLEDGYEIQDALITVAKKTVREMETTHPNISNLYFPKNESFSFLRLLRYDGYQPHDKMLDVATPHYDIGGVTIQAYADAPGFWGAPDGPEGDRVNHDTSPNQAYAFMGEGHKKVYSVDDPLKPLYHGVERVIPAGVTWVPERTAVILFLDAPEVDYDVKLTDTRPYITRALAQAAIG